MVPGEFTDVVLLDNLATQRYCSLFDLPAGVPFRFREADVCTADLAAEFAGMDAVIHLAAITNPAGSFEMQDQMERVNCTGTERVALACAAAGCPLVFVSSTSVYNVPQETVTEDCVIDERKPQSPYADSKLRSEQLLTALGEEGKLQFITCRFGTIYGVSPGMRFHTAINKFTWQACMCQPLSVWSTALHQRRPYLDLGDAVRALRLILQRRQFDNRIYNVVSENLTVAEVLEQLRKHVPACQVGLVDSVAMNQLSYAVSNERFRGLGFEFNGELSRAIGDTVALLQQSHAGRPVPAP